jgi:hypothetical protein
LTIALAEQFAREVDIISFGELIGILSVLPPVVIYIIDPETPTAKARWVLEYLNFQYITNDIKTNLFLQDFY